MYQIDSHQPPVYPAGRNEVIVYEKKPYWWRRYWDEENAVQQSRPEVSWCNIFVGLVIFALLVGLGVCIPFAVKGSSDSSTENLKNGGATKENCYIATYKGEVSLDNMAYKDEYKYSNSPEFDSLANEFCTSLKENMEELYECGEKVDSCRVDNFKPGSVKVNVEIRHTKIGKAEDVSDNKIEEETTRIMNVITKAIEDGESGPNENNLFRKEQTTLIGLEAKDVQEYVQCPPVKTPRFSRILSLSPFVNYIDDQITVKCEDGYYFPDETTLATISCLSSGKWNRELTDCKPKVCPEITSDILENGDVILGKTTGNTYKDSVWIRCNYGYSFDRNDIFDNHIVLVCNKDGTWNTEIESGCQDIDECDPEPCFNGGICTQETPGGYVCNCADGYTGKQCETDIDFCNGVTCQNEGTCIDELTDFRCICTAGYTGKTCETDIKECDSSPCVYGDCIDHTNAYSCDCTPGYTGLNCELDIDDCINNPCEHGGSCTDGVNGYTCTCLPGSTGTNCEIDDVDDCDTGDPSSPMCFLGRTCVNIFFGVECIETPL